MRRFLFRHQPPASIRTALVAGMGAVFGVAALGLTGDIAGLTMLFAPLGATCVLVFGLPASPLSQPANVIFGHALAGFIGLAAQWLLPGDVWLAAAAVGIAIAAMSLLRVTHPPAGATALVSYASAHSAVFLAFPILTGAVSLVLFASLYHRLTGSSYPLKAPHGA